MRGRALPLPSCGAGAVAGAVIAEAGCDVGGAGDFDGDALSALCMLSPLGQREFDVNADRFEPYRNSRAGPQDSEQRDLRVRILSGGASRARGALLPFCMSQVCCKARRSGRHYGTLTCRYWR